VANNIFIEKERNRIIANDSTLGERTTATMRSYESQNEDWYELENKEEEKEEEEEE